MKTADLEGRMLDYYVANAEGLEVSPPPVVEVKGGDGTWRAYKPSTFWSDGGPLIEKYCLTPQYRDYGGWRVDALLTTSLGATPLQAICRAVVRAAFGDEVDEVLP